VYQGMFGRLTWCTVLVKVGSWVSMRMTMSSMYIWLGAPPEVWYNISSMGSRTTSGSLPNKQLEFYGFFKGLKPLTLCDWQQGHTHLHATQVWVDIRTFRTLLHP